jgi:hypothetical protein
MNLHAILSGRRHAGASATEQPGYDYANHFEVGFSREEVLLRFAQVYGGGPDHAAESAHDRARVVMTPAYAKSLRNLLDDAITRYEADHGTITAAGGGVHEHEGQ